ncbi:unnamed protein product [Psylliodes chrysocephalus]|uniref:Uncharacterized protein n=1 Tax=Psylliodes chrysocephalus TaxID=3402493 RepID=A0A9P0D010_9CUCU|nr:unnamed protein product [Psylliodes chrysocephala]
MQTEKKTSSPIIPASDNILVCSEKLADDCNNELPLKENIAPETSSSIKNQPRKRKWKKVVRIPDFCFFCESDVLNFARHITNSHRSEIEVQKILSLPSKSLTRRNLIASVRKRGNHIKNVDNVLSLSNGHILLIKIIQNTFRVNIA